MSTFFALAGKCGAARRRRLGRVDHRPDRRLAGEQPLLVEQRRQRDARQARAAPLEELATIEHPAAGMGELRGAWKPTAHGDEFVGVVQAAAEDRQAVGGHEVAAGGELPVGRLAAEREFDGAGRPGGQGRSPASRSTRFANRPAWSSRNSPLSMLSACSGVVLAVRLGCTWPASGQSKAPKKLSSSARGLLW